MRPTTTVSCLPALSLVVAASVVSFSPALAAGTKTSKERLSDKGSDEQRVDNCRVPIERRGLTPRPDCGKEPDATGSVATPATDGESR